MKKFLRLAVFFFLVACCVGILCALPSFAYTEITEADYPDAFAFAMDYVNKLQQNIYYGGSYDLTADTVDSLDPEDREMILSTADADPEFRQFLLPSSDGAAAGSLHNFLAGGEADWAYYLGTLVDMSNRDIIDTYPHYIAERIKYYQYLWGHSDVELVDLATGDHSYRSDSGFLFVTVKGGGVKESDSGHIGYNEYNVCLYPLNGRLILCNLLDNGINNGMESYIGKEADRTQTADFWIQSEEERREAGMNSDEEREMLDENFIACNYLRDLHKRLYGNIPFDVRADTVDCLTDEQRATLLAYAREHEDFIRQYHTYVNDGDLADQYASTPIEQVIESFPKYICGKIDAESSGYTIVNQTYDHPEFTDSFGRFAVIKVHGDISYTDPNGSDPKQEHTLENDFRVLLYYVIEDRWIVCDVSEWNDPYSQKNRFSEETLQYTDWEQGLKQETEQDPKQDAEEESTAAPDQTSVNSGNNTEPEKPASSALPWILDGVGALVILLLIGGLLLRKRKRAG